ncbi:hypothetical protein QFC22_005703 [Naganishia vaughanmartiniae]|uniref:Uncharacterized protein n=1 Tax=Naganishia vaughanmartiniae TaxID=1424756 RepID=A0ACC2WTW3_9TREE|nr:hypothetical protein QFC22_005703 [Naganishia vaughanmartiniae]
MQICTPGQTELTVRQIEEVLTPENSVTWRAVRDLAIDGEIPEVSALEYLPRKKIAVEFSQIYGIGPDKAFLLADLGHETFDDLREMENKDENRVMLTKGSKDMQKLIPREEMEIFDSVVRETLHKADPKSKDHVETAHAYQAKAIMLTVKNALLQAGLMGSENIFQGGDKKLLFLTRVPASHSHLLATEDGEPAAMRKMEVRVCAMESLPYFRLANTGDDMLMRIFRSVAKGRGLVINEYGMGAKKKGGDGSKASALPLPVANAQDLSLSFDPRVRKQNSTWAEAGTSIPATCERDIFDYLGIPYLEPTQRSFKHYEKIFSAHPSARHILGL